MNPLAQNPFEFADKVGLHLAKQAIEIAYRRLHVSPALSRHIPRVTFAFGITAMAAAGPAADALIISLSAIFPVVAVARIIPDLPDIRTTWNADLYRKYGAIALKEREIRIFRWAVIALVAVISVAGLAMFSSFGRTFSWLMAAFMVLQISLLASHFAEAAELPEPDDGDFQPQTAGA